jgi:hypothetical protein
MYKEIKPNNWQLPNRIGYNQKIFKTFRPEYYFSTQKNKLKCKCDDDKCDIDDSKIGLYPQQRLIKDYMQFNSPYRGALLYHELGAGKSGASIAAAEGYINKKRVFVLSPASLAVNYENEIKKMTSLGIKYNKDWSLLRVDREDEDVQEILMDKYSISTSIIKKNGFVWIPFYDDDIPDAEFIKKEVEDEEEEEHIEMIIAHIIKNRYKFISYNGLTKKIIDGLGKSPFNNSIVVIDEVHNFSSRIVNGSKLAQDIYTKIMNANNCKVILLSGTPIINNPYEIATIINLIRGYMNVYEFTLQKTSKLPTDAELEKKLNESKLNEIIDEITIENENRKILVSLLPNGYKKSSHDKNTTITKSDWEYKTEKAIDTILKTLNDIKGVKIEDKYKTNYFSALPNKKEEFDEYFLDMSDTDNPKIKNRDLFMRRILGTLSYYSITGSELFPTRNPDVLHHLEMTDTQIKKYLEVREAERKMEAGKKGGVMENKTSVYRAFSRMVCNFSFPEDIERLYPKDIKQLLKKEMEDINDEDDEDDKKQKDDAPKVADIYEEKLKKAIDEIKKGDKLSYENVKKYLSPKFGYMYEDIENSEGSVLVYSQFRSVEGLGLFSEFLTKNGYKEISLKKVEGKYLLTDTKVFDRKYDNKRFIIFDSDKEKTRILMRIFNGEFKDLPAHISKYLPSYKEQLYGKIVKLFCITASGAEGISLKNVRRVLIMEPYWNNIRIDQVIGRAIRSCSHETLPKKDRNVTVYRYLMKFTKSQLDKNYSIATVDKGITTDEHISLMAEKKMKLINEFLDMLKASSFDCIINATQNKPLLNSYKCYNWAIGINNDDLSYTANIKDDYKIMKHKNVQVQKKGKGRVIVKNGDKYVLLDGKVYNYHSYKNAGVLIPEEI